MPHPAVYVSFQGLRTKVTGAMSDNLQSARSKIDRAKKHIADLDGALSSFNDSKPYRVETKRDPQTGQQIHYMASVADVPLAVSLIAGDAIHNLRSALDYLACQLVAIGTGKLPGSHVYFPIGNDAADYESRCSGQVKGARQDAIKAIDAIEPYKGGKGHQLWILHKLDIADKHRLLLTVGACYGRYNFAALVPPGLQHVTVSDGGQWQDLTGVPIHPFFDFSIETKGRICPLKAGDVLLRGIPDAEMNDDTKFFFGIALAEPGIVEGESLLKTVHDLANLVSNIIGQFARLA